MKGLGERLGKTPTLAKEIGKKIAIVVGSDAWLVDLTRSGTVASGKGDADVTLTMTDDALVALAQGESLRDLYQHGRVRVDGDARIAHQVTFFKGLV
jgi:3-hydroxyacyl-CoA dehydrogenase/3a,7a,12a-trihydroxy-5b-cholest-24-enoyl-CoA hydratase